MAISPVGGVIFTNQMTPVVSTAQTSLNNRLDFQNMVAQVSVNEKDEQVIEIRPAEENQGVDPDKEHNREEADEETKRSEHSSNDDSDEDTEELKHILDIKV